MEIMDKLKAVLNIKDPVGVPGRGFCPLGRIGPIVSPADGKRRQKGAKSWNVAISHGILSILPPNLTNSMGFS